jgi:NADH-quinone oxidoreductase subunit M
VAGKPQDYREHLLYILAIYAIAVFFLLSSNLFFFVFFYEFIILPIFFILRKFGHYYRRVQASFLILIWALLGSFFLFIGVIVLAYFGATSFLSLPTVTPRAAQLAAVALALGFLVKVPMWPFHF